MRNELHFQIAGIAGDTLDISRYKNEVHFEIDEPWSGDTESGFGRRCSVTLKKEQALELAHWLIEQFAASEQVAPHKEQS